jgi:trimethylamine--corrinoid protein Co-methyltransferase
MAVARLKFLDKNEEELVHSQSVKNLMTNGVLVRSHTVLKTLKDHGADVDMKSGVAKIPESLVKDALKSAPKRLRLYARDPKHDLELPVEGSPHLATTGLAIYMRDMETGQKRPSTRADIASFIRLADALDPISFCWTSMTANDVPPHAHGVHELWTAMQNTTKHVTGVTVLSAEDAKKQVEIAALAAGGPETLKKKPNFSVICCSIAPLSFEGEAVEGMVEFAKAGVPVISMTMSLSGGSAPITMAGTIVNANTENLASIVITQTAAKGAPHIYSSSSAPIDMRTGSINYMTSEPALISAGLGQMAKRYGLPCMVGDWGMNDSPEPGIPHSFTQTVGVYLTTMSGTDLAGGMGGLDVVKGASLEQMVIDSVLWENLRAYMRTFEFSEETASLDVVKAVGHGNTFLTHPQTARLFKKALHFWDPKKLAWEMTLSHAMVDEAKDVARKTLKEHRVPPMDKNIVEAAEKIIREYDKR